MPWLDPALPLSPAWPGPALLPDPEHQGAGRPGSPSQRTSPSPAPLSAPSNARGFVVCRDGGSMSSYLASLESPCCWSHNHAPEQLLSDAGRQELPHQLETPVRPAARHGQGHGLGVPWAPPGPVRASPLAAAGRAIVGGCCACFTRGAGRALGSPVVPWTLGTSRQRPKGATSLLAWHQWPGQVMGAGDVRLGGGRLQRDSRDPRPICSWVMLRAVGRGDRRRKTGLETRQGLHTGSKPRELGGQWVGKGCTQGSMGSCRVERAGGGEGRSCPGNSGCKGQWEGELWEF